MSDPLIRLRGISFAYDAGTPFERRVLDGVDLDVRAGERIGLAGPNGAGKTTLLHLIVGLLRPSAGTIEAFGKVRREESDFFEARARAGLLFQDPEDQLFCPTVLEDVAFGPLNLGKSRDEALAIVAETLGFLGLAAYRDRITHKLSLGEKRLVSLACVLAMKPDVLLLDEPTCGLDNRTECRITEILKTLPMAMLIVSHDREFLAAITTRAVHLSGGLLKES